MTTATAIAHPNVALVKYWGKQDEADNIPATPSLSITLQGLATRTTVAGAAKPSLRIDGRQVADAKVAALVAGLRRTFDLPPLAIDSRSNFPAAAGLASSASGFAALATAVDAAFDLGLSAAERSEWARRGSASAARSVFGGFTTLAAASGWVGAPLQDPDAWPLEVAVALTSRLPKAVPSTAGMAASRTTSPFYAGWRETAGGDFAAACRAVRERDFGALAAVAEHSCLKMHAVMFASRPPLLYWNAATVAATDTVRRLTAAGVPVFFTIDAGPQVKAVCAPGHGARVAAALRDTTGVQEVLTTGLGPGAHAVAADGD